MENEETETHLLPPPHPLRVPLQSTSFPSFLLDLLHQRIIHLSNPQSRDVLIASSESDESLGSDVEEGFSILNELLVSSFELGVSLVKSDDVLLDGLEGECRRRRRRRRGWRGRHVEEGMEGREKVDDGWGLRSGTESEGKIEAW